MVDLLIVDVLDFVLFMIWIIKLNVHEPKVAIGTQIN